MNSHLAGLIIILSFGYLVWAEESQTWPGSPVRNCNFDADAGMFRASPGDKTIGHLPQQGAVGGRFIASGGRGVYVADEDLNGGLYEHQPMEAAGDLAVLDATAQPDVPLFVGYFGREQGLVAAAHNSMLGIELSLKPTTASAPATGTAPRRLIARLRYGSSRSEGTAVEMGKVLTFSFRSAVHYGPPNGNTPRLEISGTIAGQQLTLAVANPGKRKFDAFGMGLVAAANARAVAGDGIRDVEVEARLDNVRYRIANPGPHDRDAAPWQPATLPAR